jgi:hypothetical protein
VSHPYAVFETFNRIEAGFWFAIAAALPFLVRASSPRQRISVIVASLGFVIFGITDILEAPTHGEAPGWLWLMKISCAAFLLACRFSYIGWRNFRVTDRYFLFGLLCLAAAIAIIWKR